MNKLLKNKLNKKYILRILKGKKWRFNCRKADLKNWLKSSPKFPKLRKLMEKLRNKLQNKLAPILYRISLDISIIYNTIACYYQKGMTWYYRITTPKI